VSWCAADVLVENFLEAMGLGYGSLRAENPRLIMASVTGFGSSGPAGQWPGFDQIAQGYSGLVSLAGTVDSGPMRVGVAIGDSTAGQERRRHEADEGDDGRDDLAQQLRPFLCR
jgi:crotonobetainyl-CoA:carnitine CoA-transferase CaiB-like acyl-CoA transferase